MKNVFSFIIVFLCICTIGLQSLTAQELVKEVSIADQEANFKLIKPSAYLMEIAGPNGYYFKNKVNHTNNISIANVKADGSKFSDGLYQMQITPIIELEPNVRKEFAALRAEGNFEKINDYRLAHDLPESVNVYNVYFSIKNGDFVTPDQKEFRSVTMPTSAYTWEQDHPAMYASLNALTVERPVEGHPNNLAMDKSALSEDDQVFIDDVIVDGSICVGQDCVNGENFGFDTQRLKENNLRIHFNDTSASASFPSNDWRISINDSSNGGSNYFAVEDATAGTTPFRVLAGAGNNAIYVSNSGGNVGLGTASPVVELQVTDGDSPTMRLEQNGSNGWTPQTWDVAGNETNFFVRDVTNGSKLPFKIKPGAPDNSIFIKGDGNIGLGTANPSEKLQVESGDIYVKSGAVGINTIPDPANFALDVVGKQQITGGLGINVSPRNLALSVTGSSKFVGATSFEGDFTVKMTNGNTYSDASSNPVMRLDATNLRVGIGTSAPSYKLEVCGDIGMTAATVTGGISCSSDIRFKHNVETLSGSLDKVMRLRGVSYDWKTEEFPEKDFSNRQQIGFVAQELETLVPELINTDADGYMAVDYAKLTPVLVEAIKEQQQIISAQQKEIDELQALKSQVAALSQMVSQLNNQAEIVEEEMVGEKK